jgi:SP family sugar:H+ symporter-like MFS transporter
MAGLTVYFFVIEGQGRSLEEIDTMYLERVPPRKSAKWVAPSAQEMAATRRAAGIDDTIPADRGAYSGETERNEGEAAGNKHAEQHEYA